MKGNQGGHVGASNTLYDALYEKAFVFPKLILLKLITSFCFYTAVGLQGGSLPHEGGQLKSCLPSLCITTTIMQYPTHNKP